MEFFNSAVGVLQTLVVALGAGLGIWGVINLLEGYGQDNPASVHVSQGLEQYIEARTCRGLANTEIRTLNNRLSPGGTEKNRRNTMQILLEDERCFYKNTIIGLCISKIRTIPPVTCFLPWREEIPSWILPLKKDTAAEQPRYLVF